MNSKLWMASLIALSVPMAAAAQTVMPVQGPMQVVAGTRLDVVATGEVNRVPDVARIGAGVVTQAPTATAAIRQNSQQMSRVVAALKRAGIADRDIQTSNLSLNPEYRYAENQPPVLTGYRASNQVEVRFRELEQTGKILDALVAEGANQINGPNLTIDKPEEAMDEARQEALKIARARADVYARSLGMRVTRILSVSESGSMPPPMPMMVQSAAFARDSAQEAKIAPGEQTVGATLSVTFELQ